MLQLTTSKNSETCGATHVNLVTDIRTPHVFFDQKIEKRKKMKQKKPLLILFVTAFASFLATFNETFLNIAFTPIMNHFNISLSTVQWLTTAYMLGAAIMVPISSFMYQRFKTKPLFLFTVSLLIIGSLICALAPNFTILLTGRIIQSLGTGMLIPIGMNITLSIVPKEKIGTYMGVMGAMTTLGPSLSIICAGTILNFASWHMLFWIFGILSLILFTLGLIILNNTKEKEKAQIDYLSITYISLTLIGLLYGISTIFSKNIILSITSIITGIIFLILFIKRQNKITTPLINLEPLKIKKFQTGIILNMLALMLVFSMNIIIPLHIQNALNTKAFQASITLFPATIISCLISPIAGKIYDKKGAKHLLPLGFILIFIFIILLGINTKINSLALITLLYIPVICGSALIIGNAQSFALSSLNPQINNHGVTMMSMGFQIAGCIGSSLFTGIYSLAITKGSSLSLAFTSTILVAGLIAIIGFIISLSIKKLETKEIKQKNYELEKIMKKDIYTINENANLLEALKLIINHKISGAPVIDNNNNLTGFISDGDIIKYLSNSHPLFTNTYSLAIIMMEENKFNNKLKYLMNLKVKDIAQKKIVTIDINTNLEEVCRILENKHLKKAPVLENGKMIGIINRSNITKYALNTYLDQTKKI